MRLEKHGGADHYGRWFPRREIGTIASIRPELDEISYLTMDGLQRRWTVSPKSEGDNAMIVRDRNGRSDLEAFLNYPEAFRPEAQRKGRPNVEWL